MQSGVVSSLSRVVNTETILQFFYKITNERGTKTVFTYAHVKWFYGQSERTYYLNYFIKPNESTNHHIHICTQMHQPLVTNIVHIMTMTKTYISFINWA